jgi:hypothetical protein
MGERDDCAPREQPSADQQRARHPAEPPGAEHGVDADACDQSRFANHIAATAGGGLDRF